MHKKTKLVYGFGINDANYSISTPVNVGYSICPMYRVWRSMIKRCYLFALHVRNPTYKGVTVCEDWKSFMAFRAWMQKQDWQGKQLDKDLLIPGNKIYCPETCSFVSAKTNTFTTDRGADRGEWPIGVCFDKCRGRFKSQCSNPFSGKTEHLGLFDCPEEAHQAWRRRKHELACKLSDMQSDERVAKALRLRYLQ